MRRLFAIIVLTVALPFFVYAAEPTSIATPPSQVITQESQPSSTVHKKELKTGTETRRAESVVKPSPRLAVPHNITSPQVTDQGDPANSSSWYWLLREPLFIAFVSSGFFGIIVAILGARFQHRNWKKQEEITSNKVAQEKRFDKRCEIVSRLFYLTKQREQNIWNYHHEMRRQRETINKRKDDLRTMFARSAQKYRDKAQELVAESNALLEEMKIHFGVTQESDLIRNYLEIWRIWHTVQSRITNEIVTDEIINKESEKVQEHRQAIQKRLGEIIYGPQPRTYSDTERLTDIMSSMSGVSTNN